MNHSSFIRTLGGAVLASTLAACGHPEQKFAVTVTDESGKPMAGVECAAGFYRPKKSDGPGLDSYVVRETTSAQGKAALSGETVYFNTTVVAKRSGFYDCRVDRMWITGRSGKRWEPWPVELKLVMKKIRNPHPMYAIHCGTSMRFPFPDKEKGPLGFDLIEKDWVAPFGKGKVVDFLLSWERDDENDPSSIPKGRVFLKCPNPGDGVLAVQDRGGSFLIGPSSAPSEGYVSEWIFENKRPLPESGGHFTSDFKGEVFLFRVRSELDGDGVVIQGNYGKIDGRILGWFPQALPCIKVTYYLNAIPNDKSLEWDQSTNLFQDLPEKNWPKNP